MPRLLFQLFLVIVSAGAFRVEYRLKESVISCVTLGQHWEDVVIDETGKQKVKRILCDAAAVVAAQCRQPGAAFP